MPQKDRSDWLLRELSLLITMFDDSTSSLLQGQEETFKLCYTLLNEVPENLEKSRSRHSVRQRAKKFLKAVYRSSPELFLLCTLVHITKLGENALYIRLSTITDWWKSTPQPKGLATVTKKICEAHSIDALIPPIDVLIPPIDASIPSPRKRRCLEGSTVGGTRIVSITRRQC
jgi:hypothetical protein